MYFFKVFIFLVFYFLFVINLSFAINIRQGEVINVNQVYNIKIGMSKADIINLFGTPELVSDCDIDYLCYYFYFFPNNIYLKVKRQYLVLFFKDSFLVSYFFRLL
jgi:outer membrane protein assembly factor BamE (lipoprotein component of BamABCDE complex)